VSNILSNYLTRKKITKSLIEETPSKDIKMIIAIPAYNEPELITTLESLRDSKLPDCSVEVIILINHNKKTDTEIKRCNEQTFIDVNHWIKSASNKKLKFHCLLDADLPVKHSGVGVARKIIMDEAVRRFAMANNNNGIIVSLDADTLVSNNYLYDICNNFTQDVKLNCATFYFEHTIDSHLDEKNKQAIILYELYLRYFKQALKYTGFPFAFHTIGSAFAVRATVYAKQGGMNRKQGGEDFYFLHKIFPLGNCKEINSIKVYPSSRVSDRVPFGTGPAIKKIMCDNDLLTYNPLFFTYIKELFAETPYLYNADNKHINSVFDNLDISLQKFIGKDIFEEKIDEINKNTSTKEMFISRFYQWFNAFTIIKYLNSTDKSIPIIDAVTEFLSYKNISYKNKNGLELLILFRNME
jgi:hypothetical protein